MRKTNLALFGAVLLAGVPALALAQPGPGRQGPGPRGSAAMFEQVDANRDGRVTWEETWTFVEARFRAADRDGNGGLSQAEMREAMQAAWQARRAAAQQGQAGPGPGAGPGAGQGPGHGRHQEAMFRALDANRDGSVTLEEIRPAVEARFRWLDANLDNVVERSELPQRPQGPRRGGPGTPPGPGGGANPG